MLLLQGAQVGAVCGGEKRHVAVAATPAALPAL